jgi:hypothetical protein
MGSTDTRHQCGDGVGRGRDPHFSTEPEFEEKLDWMPGFVRDESTGHTPRLGHPI